MQQSNWNRTRIVIVHEFRGFPKDIAFIVAKYCVELKLRSWIDPTKLDKNMLFMNPRADEAGMLDWANKPGIAYLFASQHPKALKKIKKQSRYTLENESSLLVWTNPAILEWLLEKNVKINWSGLSANPSPLAIKLLMENQDKIDWSLFSTNPSAAFHLYQNPDKINYITVGSNPAMIDWIDGKVNIGIYPLSLNPHNKMISWLQKHQDKICWTALSQNPGIFVNSVSKKLICDLTDHDGSVWVTYDPAKIEIV